MDYGCGPKMVEIVYMHNWTDCIIEMDAMSVVAEPLCVPQGSVLEFLLFVIYNISYTLPDIICQYGVTLYNYFEDTQLYITFDHKDPANIIKADEIIEVCVEDIQKIIIKNRLKMNDNKTGMTSCHPSQQLAINPPNLVVIQDKNASASRYVSWFIIN